MILCDVLSLSGQTSSANPSAPPAPEQLQKDLGPNLVWIPFVGRASCWGLCPGAEAKPRREVATGSSHQLGQSLTPRAGRSGAGGRTHLQVLEVGQGLAVGELRPRVAVVELVADAADIAHHGHQKVHP